MSRSLLHTVALALAVSSTAIVPIGCRHHHRHGPVARGGGPGPAGDLDDAEIAGLVGAVHTALIEQAEVAQDRGDDDAVKVFADRVLARQTQLGQQANVEFARTHLDARQTGQSHAISDESMATMRTLSSKMGNEFDRAYVESQVRLLERAVQLYDGSLAREADDAEVRAIVNRDREVLRSQLNDARALLARLPPPGTESTPHGVMTKIRIER